jgi:hypothetical protein
MNTIQIISLFFTILTTLPNQTVSCVDFLSNLDGSISKATSQTCTSNCISNGCDLPKCEHDCTCSTIGLLTRQGCDMSNCKYNCFDFAGVGTDMRSCVSNCQCTKGHCDMRSCVQELGEQRLGERRGVQQIINDQYMDSSSTSTNTDNKDADADTDADATTLTDLNCSCPGGECGANHNIGFIISIIIGCFFTVGLAFLFLRYWRKNRKLKNIVVNNHNSHNDEHHHDHHRFNGTSQHINYPSSTVNIENISQQSIA